MKPVILNLITASVLLAAAPQGFESAPAEIIISDQLDSRSGGQPVSMDAPANLPFTGRRRVAPLATPTAVPMTSAVPITVNPIVPTKSGNVILVCPPGCFPR